MLGAAVFVAANAFCQSIIIDGVVDRTTYTDHATFRVQTNAAFAYFVTLNDAPVPAGVSNTVARMDYYDLAVTRTNLANGDVTNVLMRFIVLASDRGAPERGLIKWTPYPSIPATAAEFAGAQMRLIAPQNYPMGLEVPVVARVEDGQGNERRANGYVSAPGFEESRFKILRGVGSGFLPAQTNAGVIDYRAQLQSLAAPRPINIESNTTWLNVPDILNGDVAWLNDSRISLTGSVTIPMGSSLTIGAGTVVRLNSLVNITNLGRIVIDGTADRPVVFTATNHVVPEDAGGAWGGFVMRTNTSELVANYTIFNGGGGANNWTFTPSASHKPQQPVLFVQFGARVSMTNSAIINTHGQVGNGYRAVLALDHCLYQKAITAGEYDTCTNVYNHCAIIEFPEENGNVDVVIADADYDAIYMIRGTNLFSNCLLGFSKDDCIDAGTDTAGSALGTVRVEHCWLESTLHECLAWSGHNRKTWAYDCVLMNSGQGIENGWTHNNPTYADPAVTPDCFADRLLSIGNSVGARVGDNYTWAYRGFLHLTNSLVLYNYRNVFLKTWNNPGVLLDTNSWVDRLEQIDLANTVLSAADSRFPATPVWNPMTDGPQLASWMTTPPDAPVGIGLALWHFRIGSAELTNGIPVRLSSFTTNSVSVDYDIETTASIVASGTLTFVPGETVRHIFADPGSVAGASAWRVTLQNPRGGEVTGVAAAYALPQQATNGTTAQLFTEQFGDQLVLYGNQSGYVVEQADQVTGPWQFVTGDEIATVSMNGSQRFFRLRKR